jgi:hypothetical protein
LFGNYRCILFKINVSVDHGKNAALAALVDVFICTFLSFYKSCKTAGIDTDNLLCVVFMG